MMRERGRKDSNLLVLVTAVHRNTIRGHASGSTLVDVRVRSRAGRQAWWAERDAPVGGPRASSARRFTTYERPTRSSTGQGIARYAFDDQPTLPFHDTFTQPFAPLTLTTVRIESFGAVVMIANVVSAPSRMLRFAVFTS